MLGRLGEKIMKRAVPLILLFSLIGCRMMFEKPGATQQDFAQDNYQCTRENQQVQGTAYANAQYGFSNVQTVTNRRMYQMCMEARGWTRTK
jgi:hypothetical protein